MITRDKVYIAGHLDGQRYAGYLASDIDDIHLNIKPRHMAEILKDYKKRNFDHDISIQKLHEVFRRMIDDFDKVYDENVELKRLLELANAEIIGKQ